MTDRELAAADALFAAADGDRMLESELQHRLAGAATPLIAALADWSEAPTEAQDLLAVNAANVARLGEMIEEHGWPGLRLVGADGADAAWMLAQHADRSNEQRRSWLPAVSAAVESGDADPRHLATLTDRTAVVAGQPQVYGTIVLLADDGEVDFPVPVADAGQLHARRSQVGLPPLATEAPYLTDGDLIPYGPDRGDIPVNQWPMVLEGHLSVEAALEAGIRPIHRIWATRPGDRRLGRLRALARERDVIIEQVDGTLVDELASGRTHGGVVSLVGARRDATVPQLLSEVGEGSLIVMLDGIEDPFNFGQAVRALYAAGVDGVVVRRSWETAVTTATRASAGATELMPMAWTPTADEAATISRMAGMRVACAIADDEAEPLGDADLTGGLFLLIGGERRGVTRSFVEQADQRIRITYGRENAPDLGAATSAAIIGFEALRQRGRAAG
jgi:23S rRNA (guanosine2251-2'-O)-methyltransferase